jgi:hypothetical protein
MKNKTIIFKYLDNQNFVVIKNTDGIYFFNSEEDRTAQIRYHENYGWCIIYYKLIEEISSFFSIEDSNSHEVISKWVENILQMGVKTSWYSHIEYQQAAENDLQMKVTNSYPPIRFFPSFTENDLQMKVTNTN